MKKEQTIIPNLYKVFHNTNNKEYYTFDGKIMLKDWNEYFKETLNLGLGVLNKKNEVTMEHKKTYDYIINNQKNILNLVINSLFDEYPKMQKESMLDDELMPNIKSVDELIQMIKPVAIEIYDNKNDKPYFGIEFNCIWDEEHGIGVLVNGNKILRIDDASTIFSETPYINEDNNTGGTSLKNNNKKGSVIKMNKIKKKLIINAILLFVSIIIVFILSMFQKDLLGFIISVILNIYVLISTITMVKEEKKISLFIIMVLSLLLIVFFGYSIVNSTLFNHNKTKYFDSEEYYIETAKDLEESLNNSAKHYYEPSYYFENTNLDKIVVSKYQAENEFNEKWFKLKKEELGNCNGYIVISVDQDYINRMIESCNKRYGESECSPDYIASLDNYGITETLNIKSFISCSGKYVYKTVGYDESQIK